VTQTDDHKNVTKLHIYQTHEMNKMATFSPDTSGVDIQGE